MPRSPNRADHVGLIIDPSWAQNPQAEKFVTIVNITTTKAIGDRGADNPSAPRRLGDRIKSVDDRFWHF
jgi:hypothetical protein